MLGDMTECNSFAFCCVVVFLIVHNGYNKYRLFYSDTPPVYVWNKRHIYLYPLVVLVKLVPKFNDIGFVCLCSYMSQLPFSAFVSKGIQFTKVYRLSSESLLY